MFVFEDRGRFNSKLDTRTTTPGRAECVPERVVATV
jgi:hypothetical protein